MTYINKDNLYSISIFLLFMFSGLGYSFLNGIGVYLYYLFISIFAVFSMLFFLARGVINKDVSKTFYIFLWLMPSMAMSIYAYDLPKHLGDYFLVLFVYTSVVAVVSLLVKNLSFRRQVYILKNVILFWVAFNFYLLLLYFAGFYDYGVAFSGVYENRNSLAVNAAFFLVFWLFVVSEFFNGFFYKLLIPFIISLLILSSLSSKGLVGLLLILVVYVFLVARITLGALLKFAIAIFLALTLYLTFGDIVDSSLGRLFGRLGFEVAMDIDPKIVNNSIQSDQFRASLKESALVLILEHPFTGIGLRSSEDHVYMAPGVTTYTHNNYLEIFLSSGVFSFVAYYVPLFIVFFFSVYLCMKYRCMVLCGFSLLLALILIFDYAMVSYKNFITVFFMVYSSFFVLNWKKSAIDAKV